MTEPTRSRPTLPDGYGLPDTDDGMLAWSVVRDRLTASKHYWLTSVREDGRPHVIPRWGVWLTDRFYYDGAATTRHVQNLTHNPNVTLNLENGKEAVIVEGISEAARADADGLGVVLAQAFLKYADDGYQPQADAWSGGDGGGLRVIVPTTAMAWLRFPNDATRFTF